MAGVDGGRVGQLGQPAQRLPEVGGALARVDREVGPRRLADEHRVAGQDELAGDDERAVLGPVPGRVPHDDLDRADADDLPVGERVERVLGLRDRVDRDRNAVLEREAPVARHVVGVRVRLEHAHDPHAGLGGGREVRLDRERGVDHDRLARVRVADEVRAAAEVVVDELAEEHARTVTPAPPREAR